MSISFILTWVIVWAYIGAVGTRRVFLRKHKYTPQSYWIGAVLGGIGSLVVLVPFWLLFLALAKDTRECPQCHNEIPGAAHHCPHCNTYQHTAAYETWKARMDRPTPARYTVFNSREKFESMIGRVVKWTLIAFFFIITAFPFYWMLNLSARPYQDVARNPTKLVPSSAQIQDVPDAFDEVWTTYNFKEYVQNSIKLSFLTVALTLLLSIPGAYATTRLDFRLKNVMSSGILLVYMFPAIVISIPLFVVYTKIGLRGKLSGMVLLYMSATLPVSLYMLRSYFTTIPVELEEAALIDGCTRLETIWRITIPLSLPAIVTVALYVWMIAWNEFLYALLFLLDQPDNWTLPLGLQQLNKAQEVPISYLMIGSLVITIPVIVIYLGLERFVTSGLTAGAVKG
ncbi:MAG: ABC transporter permease subunit [Chloroflexi bacterium]|nr:ABC transporter permease subunit [Chloroflexota bacterium]